MSPRPAAVISPIAHIPGVFSHYAPATGSALITKVYQHSLALERAGGTSFVLVNERRGVGYDAGRIIRFASPRAGTREWFTNNERRIDAALGALLVKRPMIRRFYQPALDAVPQEASVVVVYNQPGALTHSFKRHHGALPVLHLGNDVFARWRPREIAAALRNFEITVTVSKFIADVIQRRIPGSAPQVKVLRNGVDLSQFSPAKSPVTAYNEILFVGNMVPHKGAHHLLRAAHILHERRIDFTIRIVGSWGLSRWDRLTDYERRLRALANGLGDRVLFQPFVDRASIARVFRSARVFCMPVTWDEPAGQVVTEAMASGLPVVSANRGGIPEYLGDKGLYVDPARPRELADALALYLIDGDRAYEDGQALRRRSESMSWDARMREFDALLRERP